MSVIIHNGDIIIDDIIETDEADDLEMDRATRKMTIHASSEALARAQIDIGDALPGESSMHVKRRRCAPVICGVLYELNADYAGLMSTKNNDPRIVENLESWDTGTVRRIVSAASASSARNGIDLGDGMSGFGNMRCVDADAEAIVPGQIYIGTWSFKGIADGKEDKWIPRSFAEKQSSSSATYPGQASAVPVESNQPLVGVTRLWFATSIPPMNVAGTTATPAQAPSVPTNIWSSIADPIHVYPYGWVLDNREIDNIAGTTLCYVTDTYTYYQRYKPGGGA